jgi:hypothetical protein
LNEVDVVNVAGSGLNVIKNIVLTQTAITDDLDVFYESLL